MKIITIGKSLKSTLYGLFFVFSLITSSLAMADNADDEAGNLISSIVNAPVNIDGENKEYAHVWFKEIFGEFIFGPWDSKYKTGTVTLVSKAVGFTNILAMILGVVIVYYVLIGGALNTAHHGEALGREWSSMWIPIRTSTGFFLIMPIGTVGGGVLSFAQVFIIWTIMLGSNAATVLWSKTVDEVLQGTPTTAPTLTAGTSITTQTFRMLMCTEFYLRHNGPMSNYSNTDNAIIAELKMADGSRKYVTGVYSAELGGYTMNGAANVGAEIQSNKPTSVKFANNGFCGTMEFGASEKDKDASKPDHQDYKLDAMNVAYRKAAELTGKMVSDLVPVVQALTSKNSGPTAINAVLKESEPENTELIELFNTNKDTISQIAISFSSSLIPAIHSELSGSEAVVNKFQNEIKKGGWGRAGVWFFEIGSLPNLTYKVYNSVMDSIVFSQPGFCLGASQEHQQQNCLIVQREYSEYTQLEKNIISSVVANAKSSAPSTVSEADKIAAGCTAASCSIDPNILHNWSTNAAKSILNILATGKWWWQDTGGGAPVGSSNSMASPFETVTNIGSTLNRYTVDLWAIGLAVNVAIEAIGAEERGLNSSLAGAVGAGLATGWFTGGLVGAAKWILLTLMTALSLMAGVGFTLAYVIPFMPIITWVMMLTGYLITVVEAVIAAPLAIILMVTPEGEGIAGTRLERAMQLLAMAILKPSLMIIGLITAITMAGVAFSILNEFFFLAAEHVLAGSVFDFIAIMVIYMSATLNLSKMLIGIMHRLPDQILEWFSGGANRSFGEHESTNAVEGAMGDAKHSFGSGLGTMNKSMGGGLKNFADKARAKQEEKKTALEGDAAS